MSPVTRTKLRPNEYASREYIVRYIGFYVQYIRFSVFEFRLCFETILTMFLSSGATPTDGKQEFNLRIYK